MNGTRYVMQIPSAKRDRDEPRCKLCNQPLTFETSYQNPCPECLKNKPDTILNRFDRADKDALKVELGVSDSSLEEFCSVEDASRFLGKEWQGYRIEIFGVKVGCYSEWHYPAEFFEMLEKLPENLRQGWKQHLALPPSLQMPFESIMIPEDPDLLIALYRLRARYEDSPLYSEMHAHPYGVRRVAIHGLEYKHTKKDLTRAVKGLALIHKAAKKLGRTKGTRFYSEDEFRTRAPKAYREYYDREAHYPDKHQFASELDLSTSALFDHMRDYGWKMNTIRAAAMRL